jgi:hypothetical protein
MVAILGIKNANLPPQLCHLSTTSQAYHCARFFFPLEGTIVVDLDTSFT